VIVVPKAAKIESLLRSFIRDLSGVVVLERA
jgi:hypothetical protein